MAIVKDRGNPQSRVDPQLYPPGMWDDKPIQGVVPMSIGTVYAKGRTLLVAATVAGNVVVQYADGSQQTVPVPVGLTTIPGAITSIVSSTATATYYSGK